MRAELPPVNPERHGNEQYGTLQGGNDFRHGNDRSELIWSNGADALHRGPGRRRTSVKGVTSETRFHAATGVWSACSEDCTRTRPVFCESAEYSIVSDELCGDELPAREEHCETDACVVYEPSAHSEAGFRGRDEKVEGGDHEPVESLSPRSGAGRSRTSPGGLPPPAASKNSDKRMERPGGSRPVQPRNSGPIATQEIKERGRTTPGPGEADGADAKGVESRGRLIDQGAAARASAAKSSAETYANLDRDQGKHDNSFVSSDASRFQGRAEQNRHSAMGVNRLNAPDAGDFNEGEAGDDPSRVVGHHGDEIRPREAASSEKRLRSDDTGAESRGNRKRAGNNLADAYGGRNGAPRSTVRVFVVSSGVPGVFVTSV